MSSPNPYQPPEAPVSDRDARRGAPVKGMIFGLLVDIGGSLIAAVVLVFVWSVWLAASGMDAEAITQMLSEPDPLSTFSFVSYAVGCGFSWLGGYVCARVARETEMRCAAAVATVSSLIAVTMGTALPLALNLVLTLFTFGAVMLGGWTGLQRNLRQP
jgi:hypothetical protein